MNRYLILLPFIAIFLFSCTKSAEPNVAVSHDSEPAVTYQSNNGYSDTIPKGRLSDLIKPVQYHLDLTIDPDQTHFSGIVTIEIESQVETSFIYLHGKDLEVSRVNVHAVEGEVIEGEYTQVDETGVAKISFSEPLPPGPASLQISYKAPFNLSLEGLYKVTDDGLNYAFTQFEAVSARLCFPGFDEPAFKTPFNYSITIKDGIKAFTSTPETSRIKLENGWQRLEFAQTKPMPTYLVAFAVGDLDVVEWEDIPANDIRNRPIPLRGIAAKGKGVNFKYALENTKDILVSLEEYFQIPYPYEKLDIVAAPDFAFGAMENVGLIIYREQLLLFDDTISLNQKRRYMSVHAHELAHQWFGNLVTPEWWDDIWLNEAFATWMASVSNDIIYPEQKFRETLKNRSLGAMRNDALISARQIRQPIESNHDIGSAFDGITYSKGGGVLSMFENFLGRENFRRGVENHLNKFAWKTATATDFISAVAEKTPEYKVETIRDAFNSFLEQPGIPYLEVNTSCQDNNVEIDIAQSRYLPLGSKGSKNMHWQVPVCIKYGDSTASEKQCQLVSKPVEKIRLKTSTCPEYVLPNADGAGYYRFSLRGDDWKNLFNAKSELSTEELMAANDSFAGSFNAGELSFTDLVGIAPAMIDSDSFRVTTAPLASLNFVYDKLARSEEELTQLAEINNQLYQNKLAELGLKTGKNDSIDQTQMRVAILGFLADKADNQKVRDYFIDMAKAYTGYGTDGALHPEKADSNTISTALKIASEELGVPFAEHLTVLLDQQADGTVRGRLLGGIAAVDDPEYAAKIREWILSDRLRDNEIYAIAQSQLADRELKYPMWEWFKANFTDVKARVSSFAQSRLPLIASGFCSTEDYKDVEEFFTPLIENVTGGPRTLAQTLEAIDLCEKQVQHHRADVLEFISGQD